MQYFIHVYMYLFNTDEYFFTRHIICNAQLSLRISLTWTVLFLTTHTP